MQLVNALLTTLACTYHLPHPAIPSLTACARRASLCRRESRVASRDSASLAACIIQKRFTLFKGAFPRHAGQPRCHGGEDNARGRR